jgi:iron(III) transport system substrate-binding protein
LRSVLNKPLVRTFVLLYLPAFFCLAAAPAGAESIGVYSGRHYNSDKQLYKLFSQRTGIEVNLLEAKDDALIQRLQAEGSGSPADVLVLVDAARLDRAADLGLFKTLKSPQLLREVPVQYRDSRGRWFGLTRRVRAVIVNPKLVSPASIRTYGDLASAQLKGKLCLRDRKSVYNQSLVADQLVSNGAVATSSWIKSMQANLAQPVFSSDTALTRAVAQGQCGAALVNTYYLARMLSGESGEADQRLAKNLKLIMPNPAHVNISGAGVTSSARNPEAAQKLIEFLASPSGGKGYAEANNEYPLKGYGDNATLKRFGPFKGDGVSAQQLGAKNSAAIKLMDVSGWK